MISNNKIARLAGLLYFIVVVSGIFHLMYVPSKLIVKSDATTTFNNIVASEQLFRLGIMGGIVCYLAFLFLPLALYHLLKPTNKIQALLMVVLATVSVPISFVNLLNKFEVLTLISKADYLKSFELESLQTLVMLHLQHYNQGNQLASIFWGLWLLPFGYLVFRSGILPKFLGILLIFGCFGYVIDFVGNFLFAEYKNSLVSNYITMPGSFGEIGICLWLLIFGAKEYKESEIL